MTLKRQSIGMRLNNPGNIIKEVPNRFKWVGEVEDNESRFVKFSGLDYGIRALSKLVLNYALYRNCDTIRKIIYRYAPPHENKTEAYAAEVAKDCGIGLDEKLNILDFKVRNKLVMAIIDFEQGPGNHGITMEDVERSTKNAV